MKAFKEWNKKSYISNYWGKDEDRAAKAGWKAALDWVRDNEDTYCCGDWDDSEGKYHGCLKMDAIKKELEDE